MTDYEFKGGNDYSQEVLADVHRDLMRAFKALNEVNHNFAFVEGCELEYLVVKKCKDMIMAVSDNLYAMKK